MWQQNVRESNFKGRRSRWENKSKRVKKPLTLSKVVVYILLILLAITIIIPVGWVFVASVKQNSEFYGSPWVLPEKIYFQNFIDAWEKASMELTCSTQ